VAINDKFMLPKQVRTIEQMADLLAAEQMELTQTQRVISALESQLIISTSTFLLSRHEHLFALPTEASENLTDRRNEVLARLNTRSPATVRAVKELVKLMTGFEVEVVEYYSLYTFELILQDVDRLIDYTALNGALEVMKPAHLLYQYIITVKSLTGVLTYGGSFAFAISLPIPEATDSLILTGAVHAGGGFSAKTSFPVPEQEEESRLFVRAAGRT